MRSYLLRRRLKLAELFTCDAVYSSETMRKAAINGQECEALRKPLTYRTCLTAQLRQQPSGVLAAELVRANGYQSIGLYHLSASKL